MTTKHTFDYDLIIIGSGAAGSSAAMVASKAGKSVAIVESNVFGGDSPNFGDIPTKALLHVANLFSETRNASRFGLRSATLGYNYPSIRAWKNLSIKHTGASDNRRYYENKGVATFAGLARFISPNEITVNRRHLSAKNFIIATGSAYETPDIPGLENIDFFNPHTILDITRPPKSLLIVGGNEEGVEIAQILASFGTKIFIIEASDHLIPEYDREAGDTLERFLNETKDVITYVKATPILFEKNGLGKRVTFKRGKIERSLRVDEVLIANNRLPVTDIGLENANIAYTSKGVTVNRYLQTSNQHVFGAGDVLGRHKTTQSAFLEGQVAAHNIIHRDKTVAEYRGMPEVIYINPNIAKAGYTEEECTKLGKTINKIVVPLNLIARGNTSDFRTGFVKIIADKRDVIIGATIVSPHGAEIINELSLAISNKLTVNDVARTPHAFLSWSEAVRIAASKLI